MRLLRPFSCIDMIAVAAILDGLFGIGPDDENFIGMASQLIAIRFGLAEDSLG